MDQIKKEILNIEEKIKELQEKSREKDISYQILQEDIKKLKGQLKQHKMDDEEINTRKAEEEVRKRELEKEIKQCQIKRTSQTLEISQAKKNLNKLANKKQQMIQKYEDALRNRDIVINSVHQLDRQVMDTKKLINEDVHYIEELKKAKNLLDNDLKKTEDVNKYQQDEISKIELEIQEKEKEVSAKGKELDKLEKRIQMLEKEKEKYGK